MAKQKVDNDFKDESWRGEGAMTSETRQRLLEEVCSFTIPKEAKDAGAKYLNIMLAGEIGSGKSSLINTINFVINEDLSVKLAPTRHFGKSLTTKFCKYVVMTKDEQEMKFRLCDTMGLEGEEGITMSNYDMILNGNVMDKISLMDTIQPESPGYIRKPTQDDKIHSVVIVLNCETLSLMNDKLKDKIKDIIRKAEARDITTLAILTKIDKITDLKDASKTFHSKKIEEKVNEVHNIFGINKNEIFPVMNYSDQNKTNEHIDLLALMALKAILNYSKSKMQQMQKSKPKKTLIGKFMGKSKWNI